MGSSLTLNEQHQGVGTNPENNSLGIPSIKKSAELLKLL